MGMPQFHPNYPNYQQHPLLPTYERVHAVSDYSGKGVVIAFVDAGFSMHPDLRGRVIAHVDATTDDIKEHRHINNTSDLSWHGLMVSSIAMGDGHESAGYYRGIAHRSKAVLVKVSNPEGEVKEADILRGLEWVLANHARYRIRIVNASVGGDDVNGDPQHPLHQVVQALTEAGVVVVIAAGNSDGEFLLPPASSSAGIVVGGYDDQNTDDRQQWKRYHSNYGKAYDGTHKPDLVAPCVWIASPLLPNTTVAKQASLLGTYVTAPSSEEHLKRMVRRHHQLLEFTKEQAHQPNETLYQQLQERVHQYKLIHPKYQHVDGTSVAAPIVSGVVAQLLEANPRLSPQQVKDILCQTAEPIGQIARHKQGAGAINGTKAVQEALAYS